MRNWQYLCDLGRICSAAALDLPVPKLDQTEHLHRLLQRHGMAAIIATASDLMLNLPVEISSLISLQKMRIIQQGMLNFASLKFICANLENAGIRCIVLKGQILSHELYGNPFLRPSSDVDLLVDCADWSRIDDVLQKAGMIQKIPTAKLTEKQKKIYLKYSKDIIYCTKSNISVEVHFRLFEDTKQENFDFMDLWKRSTSIKISGANFHILPTRDKLVHLLRHGEKSGWAQLKWSLDMLLALRRLSSTEVAALATDPQLKGQLRRLRQVVRELYGIDILELPEPGPKDRLQLALVRCLATSTNKNVSNVLHFVARILAISSINGKIMLIIQRLFSPMFWSKNELPDWASLIHPLGAPFRRLAVKIFR